MSYLIIGGVALLTAFLTLFSGFGLGTLLMPAFALFFPIPIAIASTAVVHGANNLLKVSLLFRSIDKDAFIRFGIPAIVSAVGGAGVLSYLATSELTLEWSFASITFTTTSIKLVLGSLIVMFALFDLSPFKKRYQFDRKWLPLGGILSGFFGGLSGHQGAFRSMFLLKLSLDPKAFVATQSIIAACVDTTRIIIYLLAIFGLADSQLDLTGVDISLVLLATLCAFVGTFVGKQLLEKTKISVVRWVTASLLLLIGTLLITGLI